VSVFVLQAFISLVGLFLILFLFKHPSLESYTMVKDDVSMIGMKKHIFDSSNRHNRLVQGHLQQRVTASDDSLNTSIQQR